jgi:SAM-dependent methyltransferase
LDKTEVIANLPYFIEWGGRKWENYFRGAIGGLENLEGKLVLEIGPRSGKISVFFALLGARVIGVETDRSTIKLALAEAQKWGVQDRVSFFHYNGNLQDCRDLDGLEFDIIFTKSVLVSMRENLNYYLNKMAERLKPGGNCIFLENRHGGPVFYAVRIVQSVIRGDYAPYPALRPQHIKLINQVFHVTAMKKSLIPPVYLVLAEKRQKSS